MARSWSGQIPLNLVMHIFSEHSITGCMTMVCSCKHTPVNVIKIRHLLPSAPASWYMAGYWWNMRTANNIRPPARSYKIYVLWLMYRSLFVTFFVVEVWRAYDAMVQCFRYCGTYLEGCEPSRLKFHSCIPPSNPHFSPIDTNWAMSKCFSCKWMKMSKKWFYAKKWNVGRLDLDCCNWS